MLFNSSNSLKKLDISLAEIKYLKCVGDNRYILVTSTNAYLISITVSGGNITNFVVEKAFINNDEIPYEQDVIVGTASDLSINTLDIKHVQYLGGTLYIVTTDVNAYLVGVKIEDGAVTYVDVEEELIK